MKTKIIPLLFVVVLTLSACGGRSTFQQNQEKWEESEY